MDGESRRAAPRFAFSRSGARLGAFLTPCPAVSREARAAPGMLHSWGASDTLWSLSPLLPGRQGSPGTRAGSRRDPAPPARAFLRPRDRQRGDSYRREEEEEPRSDQKGEWLSEPPGASAESEAWRGIRGVLSPVKDRSAAVLPCVRLARQSPAGM